MAPPSLVQQMDMVFTWRNPRRRDGLQDDAPSRENAALGRRCHHFQQEADETFARRIPSLAACPHPGKPRKSSRGQRHHRATTRHGQLAPSHAAPPSVARPHELPHRSSLPHTAAHGQPQPQPEQARRTRRSRPAGLVAPPHPRLRGPACAHAGRRTSTRRSRLHEPAPACTGRRVPPCTSERRTGAPCRLAEPARTQAARAAPPPRGFPPLAPSRAPPKCLTPPWPHQQQAAPCPAAKTRSGGCRSGQGDAGSAPSQAGSAPSQAGSSVPATSSSALAARAPTFTNSREEKNSLPPPSLPSAGIPALSSGGGRFGRRWGRAWRRRVRRHRSRPRRATRGQVVAPGHQLLSSHTLETKQVGEPFNLCLLVRWPVLTLREKDKSSVHILLF
ncbi:hypothetical protein PVAP13_9KG344000 [Panicum virgatum]|uniref:Uncharacterized protein n=1 Tax=Panicum virgatum TaxID=38727 RepID=A0A8T0NMC5_PANVG|nr:hypothetical protein PVAP13_9KG344000 [Panicum virgatum]